MEPEHLKLLEEELLQFAKETKIEAIPWIREYVVNVDDFYSKLTLEKIENKPTGPKHILIDDYKDLFEVKGHDSGKSCKRKRVLFKGDPGIGKSTLCKKIMWDWGKGKFGSFTVVLLVFLKLVDPADAIENIVIDQCSIQNQKGQKLRALLETYGSRCLLILDGLDEHAFGQNQDVLQIVRGQKLAQCSIILTSRPHSTRQIEKYFPTVVRIDGFTKNEARKFANRIIDNTDQVEDILNFNPCDINEGPALHSVPILLSFLCLLVREENIYISGSSVETGEIYTRMIQCLYKKFVIRTGRKFEMPSFFQTLRLVGKLALRTLLSGNPLFKKSDVIKDVGSEAFDYGLLIGNEDFRLTRDATADILVTFPHQSILEFLCAFYFILMLSEGKAIESLLGADYERPIFMENPLMLHFCLWLVSPSQKYFPFSKKDEIYGILKWYVLKRVDSSELVLADLVKVYPALNIEEAFTRKEKLKFRFFQSLLSECHNIRTLIVRSSDCVDWILTSLRQVLAQIVYITVDNIFNMTRIREGLFFEGVSEKGSLDIVFKHLNYFGMDLSLYISVREMIDVSHILAKLHGGRIRNVHINYLKTFTRSKGSVSLPFLGSLNKLTVKNCHLHEVIPCLANGVENGSLPSLTHIGFIDCRGLAGNLSQLFGFHWPQLTHVSLHRCTISIRDVKAVSNGHLPKLTSIIFPVGYIVEQDKKSLQQLKELKSMNVTSIFLDCKNCRKDGLNFWDYLNTSSIESVGVRQGFVSPALHSLVSLKYLSLQESISSEHELAKLTNNLHRERLCKLDIGHSSGIAEHISTLISHDFPSLNTLILNDCELSSSDMHSLALAKVEGRLPELKHLDVSDNVGEKRDFLKSLFYYPQSWKKLLSLDIWNIEYHPEELRDIVNSKSLEGLQELKFVTILI